MYPSRRDRAKPSPGFTAAVARVGLILVVAMSVLPTTAGVATAADGDLEWARTFGAAGSDEGQGVTVDGAGNVYTTGWFVGTMDSDPGAGVMNLTAAGLSDVFVSKLDTNGDLVWARAFGGANSDVGRGAAVDAAGNVYTTGYFLGTSDFDPGAGVLNLASAGSADVFVSKLDTNGDLVWARRFGGTGFDQGSGVVVDGAGNVYTTGYFLGTVDFDPGAGVLNLTSSGGWDVFVSKLDTNGNLVWAGALGGTGTDIGRGVTMDAAGNVYAAGWFAGTADFDPGAGVTNLTSAGSDDAFVSKLDTNGNLVWARRFGGVGLDQALGVAVDGSGNTHTTGYFNGTADFDPGVGVTNLTSAGSGDAFVSKLDTNGNLVWARRFGGTNLDAALGVAVDGSGNTHTVGWFTGTADFDPGVGVTNLTSAGSTDVFVSKLDTNGNLVWARAFGGTDIDEGYGVAVDGSGNTHTTGGYEGTADLDPGAAVVNQTSAGGDDVFVSKLAGPPPVVVIPPVVVDGRGSGYVSEGGAFSTDHSGNGAQGVAPIETMIMSPNRGFVRVQPTGEAFSLIGYSFVGETLEISAPDATPEDPLVLVFELDPTRIPIPGEVQVFRDGVLVPDCRNQGTGFAVEDPCVEERRRNSDNGNPEVVVLTSTASEWAFGFAERTCRGRPATIVGDGGDNVLIGTSGDDVIWAGPGNDVVRGRGGNDYICLGAGDDEARGGKGKDHIYGHRGMDLIHGGPAKDVLFGGRGSDTLKGGKGSDTGNGGLNNDSCTAVEAATNCES